MGYELDKLMKQYGVSSPDTPVYTGPSAPVVPTMPEKLAKDATDEEKAAYDKSKTDYEAYQKDPSAFNEMMRKYGLAQKEYNQYLTDFDARISNTPMYGAEYDIGLKNTPKAVTYDKPLDMPTYGAVPVTLAGKTADEKADYYKRLRDIGYTDADIRGETTKNFGKIDESGWRNLLNRVYPEYQSGIETAYGNIGRSGYGGNVANIDDAGYNYWLNQLSSGAVKPGDLNTAVYNAANTWMPNTTFDATKVPTNFDWSYYVNKYPDLSKAGIDTLQEAQRHYALYGAGEGRSPYENAPMPKTNSWVNPPGFRDFNWWSNLSNNNVANAPTDNYNPSVMGSEIYPQDQIYAAGGAVRRFRFGGDEGESDDAIKTILRERLPQLGGTPPPAADGRFPEQTSEPPAPLQQMRVSQSAPVTTSPAAQPVTPPPAAVTPVSPAANDLMSMMNKYLGAESMYGPELTAARKRVTAENAAFQDMIANAMKGQSNAPDKAEMYFRLAAAFGSPTKTGAFGENLALAGKEMAEYAKDVRAAKRADQQLRMQLGLEAQKLKAQSAREELTTLRTLAGEEMKDKRAIVLEYIKSGRPQSEAGKAAVDAGFKQGTPEFNKFVNDYIDEKIKSGNLLKEAMVQIAAGNLNVAQSGLEIKKAAEKRQTEAAGKLTPAEVKLKSEAETTLGGIDDSMTSLKRAYSLNPNTFDGTLVDIGRRKLLEQTDPKDPRVLATREQKNLLSKGAIDKLRASFGGNPTEGERAALLDLEGLDSKSKEERALIMKNTYKLLQARRQREQKRLNDINAGLYRETTPAPSGEIE